MEKPIRQYPKQWEHFSLWRNVAELLANFDLYFQGQEVNDIDEFFGLDDFIVDLPIEDIFTLNSIFAGACERATVKILNKLKPLWNVKGLYDNYKFYRQGSLFPDVLLCNMSNRKEILMGIELKGWYLFSKEKEPSFRYCVSPNCCAPQDLVMVVPWCLSDISTGRIIVRQPFVDLARYAASYRNYHWASRRTTDSLEIISPPNPTFYPRKNTTKISDEPSYDGGYNFGRFARSGIMDQYLKEIKSSVINGKSIKTWLKTLYK